MIGIIQRGASGAVSVGLSVVVVALVGLSAGGQEAPTFVVDDFGVVPRPSVMGALLGMESVQQALGLSDAQQKQQAEITTGLTRKIQAARREANDRVGFQKRRDDVLKEAQAALLATLKPEQRERLDQIQLQAQGPLAFGRPENAPMAYVGPPLSERLKLTGDQSRRIREIVQAGQTEIAKAVSFPIVVDRKDGPPTMATIDKLIDSPEFQAARKKAGQAGREATAAVTRRVEEVLTAAQRDAYHRLLGEPFDLSKLRWAGDRDRDSDRFTAAQALGVQGGGGQQSDPTFDTRVARPAYAAGPRHPRILFDEAHHNFHTAGGRYMPFANLMRNDGYEVIPNREKFSREVLPKGDILVIANALGAEGMGQPGAANPAFTDAECDAVRDWVAGGGSLLFITDHAPMGAAAQCLAKRLGVSMSTGATSDPVNSSGGDTSLVFSRENHLLGEHPITRGRVDSERVTKVQTFTGTSLKGPDGSAPILKLADTAVDLSLGDGPSTPAAGRAQGLAFALGKGRVVVMGEAAELSAQLIGTEKFGMNVPGIDNRQMALNIMHWLSGLLEPREGLIKRD